jgi:hypothetical protein
MLYNCFFVVFCYERLIVSLALTLNLYTYKIIKLYFPPYKLVVFSSKSREVMFVSKKCLSFEKCHLVDRVSYYY